MSTMSRFFGKSGLLSAGVQVLAIPLALYVFVILPAGSNALASDTTYCKNRNCSTHTEIRSVTGVGNYTATCVDWYCVGSASPSSVPNTGSCKYTQIAGKSACEHIKATCGAGSYIVDHISCTLDPESGLAGWSYHCEHPSPYLALESRIPATCCVTCDPGGGGGLSVPLCIGVDRPAYVDPYLCSSPIIVDVTGNGAALSSYAAGVSFDLDCDGTAEQTAWTTASTDDAFLCLDRDSNGTIDDGSELFGNLTLQYTTTTPNGYFALSVLDATAVGGNHDGVITSSDTAFTSLRLWFDDNHNGVSESGELKTLSQVGVTILWIGFVETPWQDSNGNWFRYVSSAYANGITVGTSDVWFKGS